MSLLGLGLLLLFLNEKYLSIDLSHKDKQAKKALWGGPQYF